jgi:hypothetical protein
VSQTTSQYLDDFGVALAMWADENLFGHGIADDEEYEGTAEQFADELHERAYQVLTERPVR